MKHYTARGLRRLPTISQGQFSNLKIDDGKHRVWLSRMTVADGMPYENAIEVEALIDGVWTSVAQYPGNNPNPDQKPKNMNTQPDTDKQHTFTGNPEYPATPNKAQHSPPTINWRSGGVTDAERIANLQFSLRNEVDAHVKVIKERDALKAHASQLAEALRAIGQALAKDPSRDRYGRTQRTASDWQQTEPLRKLAIQYDIGGSYDIQEQVGQVAREALAAWEAAQ